MQEVTQEVTKIVSLVKNGEKRDFVHLKGKSENLDT